jgi:hypothetical protein
MLKYAKGILAVLTGGVPDWIESSWSNILKCGDSNSGATDAYCKLECVRWTMLGGDQSCPPKKRKDF